jgi:cytochrome d ubiquinol oxidase subunit II
MTPVLIAAAVGLLALALYAIFGGADFGGGAWDLLATGPRRDAQRDAIAHAIGPVWEANHVWLIFAIVILFACFPIGFADIATGLNAPLTFALAGIVLRGAAFVFRNYSAASPALVRTWTVVFGISSLLAPFWLGDAVGALATGSYAWLSPFALSTGFFALVVAAQIAGVFLLPEVHGDAALTSDFRRRAIGATLAVWVTGLAPAALARVGQPALFAAALSPTALVAVGLALVMGVVVLLAVARGWDNVARFAVGIESLAILGGWFGAQAPELVPGKLTYIAAAANDSEIVAVLIAVAIGAVILIPSLILLFSVFKGPSRPTTADES